MDAVKNTGSKKIERKRGCRICRNTEHCGRGRIRGDIYACILPERGREGFSFSFLFVRREQVKGSYVGIKREEIANLCKFE